MSAQQFLQEDVIARRISFFEALRRLWPYSRRYLGLLALTALSIAGLAILQRFPPHLLGQTAEIGIKNGNFAALQEIAWTFLFVELCLTLFTFTHQYLFAKLGNLVLRDLRADLLKHLMSLRLDYFHRNPTGRIVNRLTADVVSLGDLFTDGVISVVTQVFVLLALVVAMALISVKLTLLSLLLTPFFLWISIVVSRKVNVEQAKSKKLLAGMSSFLTETINGAKIVNLYNYARRRTARFLGLNREYKTQNLELIVTSAWMQPILNLFSGILMASALFFASRSLLADEISLGALVAFLLHTQDFLPPIREILEKYQQFQNSLTSADRIFHFLDEKPEDGWTWSKPPLSVGGQIEIRDLSFRYSDNGPEVLKNISFVLPSGSSMALIGRTGSGKTTLTSLLQRLYVASPESIFLDGRALESLPLRTLRSQVGLIQQDPFLFRGSLRSNLNLSDEAVTDEQMAEALRSVGLWENLVKTGRGLDSFVEEKGTNFSLGEKQMIAFARILLQNPKLLILDEATANIDSIAEEKIQRATQKIMQGRTSILIAHRLSTIEDCDTILFLENGEIKERGSHDELMDRDSKYRAWREEAANS